MAIARRRVLTYLVGAFVVSWGLAGVFWLTHLPLQTPQGMAMAVAYMFGPALSVLLVRRLDPEFRAKPLDIKFRPNRYFVIGWLGPALLAFVALGIGLLMPGVHFSPGMEGMYDRFAAQLGPEKVAQLRAQMAQLPIHPVWLALVQGLIAGVTVNAVAGFGEELGWRGLLQTELAPLGFWRSSALIGVIWGVWHAPIILMGHNYPQHPVVGVLMMIAFCVGLAPLFGWVRLRSGSVIAPAIAHGTLNATAGLAIMVVRGGDDLTVGMTGAAGLIALALANLALWIGGRASGSSRASSRSAGAL